VNHAVARHAIDVFLIPDHLSLCEVSIEHLPFAHGEPVGSAVNLVGEPDRPVRVNRVTRFGVSSGRDHFREIAQHLRFDILTLTFDRGTIDEGGVSVGAGQGDRTQVRPGQKGMSVPPARPQRASLKARVRGLGWEERSDLAQINAFEFRDPQQGGLQQRAGLGRLGIK